MKKLILLLTILLSTLASMAQTPFITTANLNMRTLPCTCAGITKTIPKGATVYVLNFEDDSWARVTYNGHTNYVYRKFIERKTSATSKNTPTAIISIYHPGHQSDTIQTHMANEFNRRHTIRLRLPEQRLSVEMEHIVSAEVAEEPALITEG